MNISVNSISVVIPTRNRPTSLLRTLRSLEVLKESVVPWEVIVVDNSAPGYSCEELISKFSKVYRGPAQIRFCKEDTPGLLSGRHRGFYEANGDVVAYVDDDVVFTSQWLEGILDGFSDQSVALCGGPTTPLFLSPPPAWLDSFWCKRDSLLSYLPELSLTQTTFPCILEVEPNYIFGLNFVIRKNILREAGGFHPDCVPAELQHFQGDGETGLAKKIQHLGYKAIYHHKIHLLHQIDANRLKVEYFQNRYFYQGVCDSYTRLRGDERVFDRKVEDSSPMPGLGLSILRRLKKSFLRRKDIQLDPTEAALVKQKCIAAYQRGYSFHQECARRSERLRKWIKRGDYFEYTYPSLEEDIQLPMRIPVE
jgi:glycosyltransferase involved in cell wall biosynthesis